MNARPFTQWLTLPLHLLCLHHQQGSCPFAVWSYSTCSTLTLGQRPGKTVRLPVLVVQRQMRLLCAVICPLSLGEKYSPVAGLAAQ